MNTSPPVDLQYNSPFLIQNGSEIFTYLQKLNIEHPLQNIRFFDTNEQNDDIISLIPFHSIYSNDRVNSQENNTNYFSILQELKSPTAPRRWVLIDCNDIEFVGLCDLIFKSFHALQDDFDISIPSCQPNGHLCLIGFGENIITSTPLNDGIYKSNMVINFLEKLVRVILLCSKFEFGITPRELECTNWVSKGKTSSEIADILSISESTVDKHVAAICQKLDAVNRMQMIAKAVRLGLI